MDNLTVLGNKVTEPIDAIEVFDNPGASFVTMEQTEFTALCPVTGQPDYGKVQIFYQPDRKCIESKSLKLYLLGFRNKGAFTESLSKEIFDHIWEMIEPITLTVTVIQNPRGGIGIEATTRR
jgi:7-cyano-7-deazaguanine reductase